MRRKKNDFFLLSSSTSHARCTILHFGERRTAAVHRDVVVVGEVCKVSVSVCCASERNAHNHRLL